MRIQAGRAIAAAVALAATFASAQQIPLAGLKPEQEAQLAKTQEKFEFQVRVIASSIGAEGFWLMIRLVHRATLLV